VVLAELVSPVLLAVTVFVQFVSSCSSRTTCLPSFPLLPVTATVTIAHLPAVHM
jgi:hypothetical protein